MKWSKAVQRIESALAEGKEVEVRYHRKWARNSNELDRWDIVDAVSAYDWQGQQCKGVSLRLNLLDEDNYIIDEITIKEA